MTSAVPQQLLSLPKVEGLKGIETRIHRIHPTNSTGASTFAPDSTNRLTFSIPAYKNGFLNNQRSYLSFKVNTNAATTALAPGAPVFNRLVVRTGNGQVIEDIQNYSTIQRILSNFEDGNKKYHRGEINGDYRQNLSSTIADVAGKQFNGYTYQHDLLSGVLGKAQQHYIPVGLFNASGGFSFEIELYLEDAVVACVSSADVATANYTLSEVALQMEIVTLPSTITDRLNNELHSNNKVAIPFSTYRLHQAYFPQASQSVDVNISESAHDLETVYTVLRPQVFALNKQLTNEKYRSTNNLSFFGGYGILADPNINSVKSYQWRYDSKYYPDAKAQMAEKDGKEALFNALHLLDLAEKPVYCAGQTGVYNNWDAMGTFAIVQSFKTSRDDYLNGLNSSSSGAPLELTIDLRAAAVSPMRIESFVKSNYTLNIMKGGMTNLINGKVEG